MGVTSYIRRQFKNAVAATDTLASPISSGAASFTNIDGTTFPDGSVGPFIVTLDQGQAAEEKVLVASRSGAVFTVAASGRGYNGTTAAAHSAGASVLHTIDQQDMDEANQTMFQTIGAIAAKGDLLVGSAANTLVKLAVGSTAQTLQVVSGTLAYVGFGSGRSQNVGTSNADGTDTTYARSDHVHNLPIATVESLFTADKQILSGTGSGTGELIDLLAALEEYFASNGQVIVGTGAGTGELFNPFPVSASVATGQTTASTTFTDLATAGPAVTVTTGTAATVILTGNFSNNNNADGAAMGFAVSGASTIGATVNSALLMTPMNGSQIFASAILPVTGLTAGSNTFTAKYEALSGGTASFQNRSITVLPAP